MNKIGSNPFLKIYIIICAVCFTLTVLCLISLTLLDDESKILDIMTFFGLVSPYSFFEFLSLIIISGYSLFGNIDMPLKLIIFLLYVLILWAVSIISVLQSAKSPKPWHIPAVVLLSIDTILKFIMLLEDGFSYWDFSIFLITALLLDGLFFFLIWKIRKYATADEPEQIQQKHIDNGLRDI